MDKNYPAFFFTWFNKFLQVPYMGSSKILISLNTHLHMFRSNDGGINGPITT